MTKVGTTIYLAEWQKCDWKIQQWLPFVLAKTQCSIGLDVVPIGRANHVLLLMASKSNIFTINCKICILDAKSNLLLPNLIETNHVVMHH